MLLALSLLGTAHAGSCDALVSQVDTTLANVQDLCLTDALRGIQARAHEQGLDTCLQDRLATEGLGLPADLPDLPAPPAPSVRDSFGVPNLYETEHFAIRWGNSGGPSTSQAQQLGERFEAAWAREIEEMGFPQPAGTSQYKLNIYVGDTGNGTPSVYGNAGYFYQDSAGYPMIVMNRNLSNTRQFELTAAHEFFHSVQSVIDTYQYTGQGQGSWYYEASASWIEVEVFPTNANYANMLMGWAFQPELPVNFFDYPDQGTLSEYHQYGAFIFVRYLAEFHGGWELIQRSFMEAPYNGDPMLVLDDILAESGWTIEQAFYDFAARGAAWDFEHREWFDAIIDAYGGWNSGYSHRPSGTVGSLDITYSPNEYLPETFGANYWQVNRSLPDSFDLTFTGDTPAGWYVALEQRDGVTFTRYELQLDGPEGVLEVRDRPEADEAWIVVAATNGTTWTSGRTYDYSFQIAEVTEPVDTGEPVDTDEPVDTAEPVDTGDPEAPDDEVAGGCACSGSGLLPGAWVFLGALGLLGRRRR